MYTGGSERMRIDTSGTVGIGTSSPAYQLHISGSDPRIELTDTDTGADCYITANSSLGSLAFSADTDNELAGSAIRFLVDGSERTRINASGNWLLGTTTEAGRATISWISASQAGLTTRSTSETYAGSPIVFQNSSGGTAGFIGQSTSTVSYNTSSDYRLKENIAPMTGALEAVALLKPVTYTWKVDGSSGQGFIAHELAEVVPDCVSGEKDAVETYTDEDGNEQTRDKYQGVDTSFLVATLTAAIQEQTAIINDLKARIETLEAK
jgi:hypothetical protein